jgi:hypothetical protein
MSSSPISITKSSVLSHIFGFVFFHQILLFTHKHTQKPYFIVLILMATNDGSANNTNSVNVSPRHHPNNSTHAATHGTHAATYAALATSVAGTHGTPSPFHHAAHQTTSAAYPSTPIAAYHAAYYAANLPITAVYLSMSTTCHATKYPQDSKLNFPSKSNKPRWKEINHTSSRIKSHPLIVSNVPFKSRVTPTATSSLKVSMPLNIKSSREGKNQSIERKDSAPIM